MNFKNLCKIVDSEVETINGVRVEAWDEVIDDGGIPVTDYNTNDIGASLARVIDDNFSDAMMGTFSIDEIYEKKGWDLPSNVKDIIAKSKSEEVLNKAEELWGDIEDQSDSSGVVVFYNEDYEPVGYYDGWKDKFIDWD